jgi:hypothetical protein
MLTPRVRIFSRVGPFYERAVNDLDLSRSLTACSQNGRTPLKIRPLERMEAAPVNTV